MHEESNGELPLVQVEFDGNEAVVRLRRLLEITEETLEDTPVIKYVYEMHEGRMPWYEGCAEYVNDHYDALITIYESVEKNNLATAVRDKRDKLLEACDYLMALDYPLSTAAREQWREYRQALRDIPQQEGFPNAVEWPTKPQETGGSGTILKLLSSIESAISKISMGTWWKDDTDG